MPKNIRLNKAIKEFNISVSRAVEFLKAKDIEIDSNPNALLAPEAYSALEAEFKRDGEQKKASSEVVISKVPEEKIELKEEKAPEVIRAKSSEKLEPKVLGKIDLGQDKVEEKKAAEVKEEPVVEVEKNEELIKSETEVQKTELKVLDKIDLSQIESSRPRPSKKSEGKKEKVVAKKEEKPVVNEEEVSVVKKEEIVLPKKEEELKKEETATEEPQKIETNYQKLEGPKILKQTVDLSQFDRPKKKKRKRITKATDAKPAQGQNKEQDNKTRGNNTGGARPDNKGSRGGKKKRGEKTMPVELTEEQVKNQIKETLEKLTNKGGKSKSAKYRKEKRTQRREQDAEQQELEAKDRTLKVTEFITVNELASLMDVSPMEVISACFALGVMVTMNQRLEADTLTLVAEEFGFDIVFADAELTDDSAEEEEDTEEDLVHRAPIVTVMGHVDHGKTSLLDYIRKTNVIAGESGGITQHIGAYNVKLENGERITFLDTPGHEAFTAMRARGAQVTDIAIIVIAADDDVMPQTKEAISHAQAAGVPMIIAINKVDKPNANPDKIREQLSQLNILVEEWGGNVQSQEISAKFGNNVDLLLEKVLIQAELLELKANPNKRSNGVIIEAALDKGRGYVATMLVQAGTLKVGDYVLAGKNHGKVKAMLDERGNNMEEAGPSIPVTILGLDGAPTAGDKFKVYEDEREAKNLANKREQLHREQSIRTKKHLTLDEIGRRIALGDFKELNIILKGDVDGSVEALSDMLQKLSTEEIQINILHKGVGQITESDILLATASDAVVIGFNVRAGANAKDLADKEEIEIRTYSVIYDAIDDVKEAMEGMLSPEIKEQVVGNVEIREVFKISKVGSIAGCMVLTGKVTRNSKIRLLRDGIVKFDGELESLKRFKDDVKEVAKGYECGLNLKGYNDIEVGDVLEVYEQVSVKKKLK
ncbi:translation initiation factor IF-2 [Riemerella anatipestifer]|uniref:translation initiation factor IF-2 n=1 Tax=Riemerella anatipestifer TaxID=34085 RepID=UPI00208E8756|nr:translation initiation factor IF-2 [Riemerella anatipestifer]MCO4303914.1 translation initiation factor IF-2 [Riemerella anatipestifer]MCO7352780.1 translation initiation factor IF-2 [Riemerella anatipestifer]MCQ4039392.1 translation initiation factor IF-2 [Riemerella anatipestifer]MCT6760883.1 translation initiation factor IF-2 [Riemerella anatipestifer]MCT6764822.1 translation initiation factor IF-2 [Riemerella anatipestifer]